MAGFGLQELMVVWAMFFGGIGVPLGNVPGEEDPYLSQIAPEECLMYVSWSGAVPANPENNVTEKWMAQPEVKAFWKHFFDNLDQAAAVEAGGSRFNEAQPILVKTLKLMFTEPGAMYIYPVSEENLACNFAFKLGEAEAEITADFGKLDDEVLAKRGWQRQTEHGMEVVVMKEVGWNDAILKFGIHNGYLLAAFAGEGEEASFDDLFASEKTPEPNWLTEIKDELPVDRRGSIGMIDMERGAKVLEGLEFRPVLKSIEGVKRIGFVTGVNADGFLSRTWIQTEGELGSFFGAFKGEPLGEDELSRIRADQEFTGVSRLSTEEIYNGIEQFAKSTGSGNEFDELVAGFEGFAGMTLKEDLLEKIDDFAFLHSDLNFGSKNPFLIGIGIKDEMAFVDTIEAFSLRIKELIKQNDDLIFGMEKVDDVVVYSVEGNGLRSLGGEVLFAQAGDRLLLCNDFKMLEKHIKNSANIKPDDTLFVQPDIKKLFEFGESIGSEGPIAIIRIDTIRLLERYWPILKMFEKSIPDLIPGPIPSNFPSTETMTNGLTPNLSASFRTENGYQLYHKSVTASSNIPMTAAAAIVFSAVGIFFSN